MLIAVVFLSTILLTTGTYAHLSAWSKGMYCAYGPTGRQDLDTDAIVYPLYQLPFEKWWMHHVDDCDNFPPPAEEFLELPAGGSFTVEIATNRAYTTFSYGGSRISDWPDGRQYPEDYNVPTCIIQPNMHTENHTMAAGTAFAISYTSDLKAVKPENLAVFTVVHHTPWKRMTTYHVPAALPACPPDGCICAWGWVPDGCGDPNFYMQPFKCRVTGATSIIPVATAQPPRWCEGNPIACVIGAKQMVFWHQASGNNIFLDGLEFSGKPKSPSYNHKLGFANGAQNDIFLNLPSTPAPSVPAASNGTMNPGAR